MKEFRNVTSFVQVKDFQKLGIYPDSGKRKGRGMYSSKDKRYIVCLYIKVFVCHKTCLIPLYEEFALKTPNVEYDDWSYSNNCMK